LEGGIGGAIVGNNDAPGPINEMLLQERVEDPDAAGEVPLLIIDRDDNLYAVLALAFQLTSLAAKIAPLLRGVKLGYILPTSINIPIRINAPAAPLRR
jgi:hypothetical protein